ncbi:hypothetical protein [Halomicrococcus sp. SG-WS-1]|uniref:hypothetical protein n=1 Tax=Halomicrococcus sp. SG-WS-1 TaxID=3439057 RepID=UPI003F798E11
MIDVSGVGVLAAAAVLGITHGFEPDHAAGISAMTTDAHGRTHAAFVGGSFAVGHVVVVLAWVAVLIAIGRVATAPPAVFDTVGTTLAGLVLFGVACVLAAKGTRRVRGLPVHSAPAAISGPVGQTVSHAHLHLHHSHDSYADYLRTGVIGSLFALSPPVSMLALVSTVVPTSGLRGALVAVAVYALAITSTMSVMGGGIGELFSVVQGRGKRVHAAFELVTSVVVLGFALRLLL